MSENPVVVVLHGPSGVGKDTVIDALRERTGIHRAMSSTTRAPRDYERDGIHYHFLSEAEFQRKVEADEFLEHALVYGEWKGLEAIEVLPYLERGDDVIIRTDIQGAREWRRKLDGAVFVLLVAEHPDVLHSQRDKRDGDGAGSAHERRTAAEAESTDTGENDYVVVNRHGQPDAAVSEIAGIIERERRNPARPRPRLRAQV